jgi:hypothetical protein
MHMILDARHHGDASTRATLREIRDTWPPTVSVPRAASALGVGRATLYEAIRIGNSPVKTVTVLGRIVVLTADLIRLLEGGDRAQA